MVTRWPHHGRPSVGEEGMTHDAHDAHDALSLYYPLTRVYARAHMEAPSMESASWCDMCVMCVMPTYQPRGQHGPFRSCGGGAAPCQPDGRQGACAPLAGTAGYPPSGLSASDIEEVGMTAISRTRGRGS